MKIRGGVRKVPTLTFINQLHIERSITEVKINLNRLWIQIKVGDILVLRFVLQTTSNY